jgi:pimeloyl-ACP methyl ester carboxylesterase
MQAWMPHQTVGHVLYLHGFASSAKSSKAAFFAERLAQYGIQLVTPDFNEPDFENLTVTRMIGQVRDTLADIGGLDAGSGSRRARAASCAAGGPVGLIGSSLGAFVAVHAAAQQDGWSLPVRVDRLVLLAPALDFSGNRLRLGNDAMARWKATDRLDVFHYGFTRTMTVRYALNEDAERYDSFSLRLDLPTLVFQGTRDELVDPAMVRRWAERRKNVTLRLLDDDHQLLSSLDRIWGDTFSFLLPDHGSARTIVR